MGTRRLLIAFRTFAATIAYAGVSIVVTLGTWYVQLNEDVMSYPATGLDWIRVGFAALLCAGFAGLLVDAIRAVALDTLRSFPDHRSQIRSAMDVMVPTGSGYVSRSRT